MHAPLVAQIALRRSARSLPGSLYLGTCLALGPILALFLDLGPIWGHSTDLVRPWLALVTIGAGSLALWSLAGLDFARRTQPYTAGQDLLVGALTSLAALALAGTSMQGAGSPAPWMEMLPEALRMGAMVALTRAMLPDDQRILPLLLWLPAWVLPTLVPGVWTGLLSPFATTPTATVLTAASLFLTAQALDRHALRRPR